MTEVANPFGITREDVLELAATKLANEAAGEEYVGDRVKRKIEEAVTAKVQELLVDKIDAVLETQLQRLLDQTVQPVDIFGDKRGEPTTIRDELCARARDFWSTPVGKDGKPASGHDYYGDRKSRAEWMLGKMVADQFAEQVKANAASILATFKEALRKDGHAALDKHLDDLVRVKSR